MDAATIAILKKAVDLARLGIEYVQHDQQVMLGLRKPQWVEFTGPGLGRGNFDDGILRIVSDPNGNRVRLYASIFPASSGFWNGPDGCSNKVKDGRLPSSLWHDLIWLRADKIAAEWGCSALEVMQWANGMLSAGWIGYAELYPAAKNVKTKARISYGATQFAAPWYHRVKILFGISVIILCLSGCTGCALFDKPPDVTMTGSSGLFDDDVEAIQPWISTNVVEGVR